MNKFNENVQVYDDEEVAWGWDPDKKDLSEVIDGVKVYDDEILSRWRVDGEKNMNKIISMAYNILTAVTKAAVKDPDMWENWLGDLRYRDRWNYLLDAAYYKAIRYKRPWDFPSPAEYSKALVRLMKRDGRKFSDELYKAAQDGPKMISKRAKWLFSNYGYSKKYSVDEWEQLINQHLIMLNLCTECLGLWYTEEISLMGWGYAQIEEEDPFWRFLLASFERQMFCCSKNFYQALRNLDKE